MHVRYKAALTVLLAGTGCALLFKGVAATAAHPSKIPFTFITVDVPVQGAGSTMVVGVNNRGDVVGSYNFIPGAAALGLPAGFLGKAFVWRRDGRFTTIDGPGPVHPELCQPQAGTFKNCYYIEARGINEQGDIVGTYSQDILSQPGGLLRAFYQRAGGPFSSYLFPGHTNTIFQGITTSGVIYGCFHDEGIDDSPQESMHAIINLLRPNGTVQNLDFETGGTTMNVGGSPGAQRYAGVWYNFATKRHSSYVVVHGRRVNFDMPGSNLTNAWDMNDEGEVVGVWGNNPDPIQLDGIPFHGFLRDRRGNYVSIDYPGSLDTHLFGINERGDMVGSYVDQNYKIHGLIVRQGDRREHMNHSAWPSMGADPNVVVAMMPVIPKELPLLAPAKSLPACHRVGRRNLSR